MKLLSAFLLGLMLLTPGPLSAGSKLGKHKTPSYDFREGDIVFQGNAGDQSEAVRAATDSPYTHCGIIFRHRDEFMVIEAIGPVKVTPLKQFIARSLPGTFHARRLKQAPSAEALAQGRVWASQQSGVPYDPHFRWDDDKLYCSEFVWKAYAAAGVKLCPKRAFRSYDLDDPTVRKIVRQRYGGMAQLPLGELAVAPGDLAESKLLVEVPKLP